MTKILAIDDDKTILRVVESIVENMDYEVIYALNGEEGLEKAKYHLPDAIILDRQMPRMDGNQVLMELKNDDTTKDIPVMMLTGDKRVSDITSSLDLGASDYIVKPFDSFNFVVRLNKILNKNTTSQQDEDAEKAHNS